MADDDEIALARERVRRAEQNVEEQRRVIAEMQAKGHSTELAIELLTLFEDALRMRRQHLESLLKR